jgi:hypothetical protein
MACSSAAAATPVSSPWVGHAGEGLKKNIVVIILFFLRYGRENWIHIGSQQPGPRVAAILSVVESCRRLKIRCAPTSETSCPDSPIQRCSASPISHPTHGPPDTLPITLKSARLAVSTGCLAERIRSDGLTNSKMWREPFAKRRCLVPASGLYEWPKPGHAISPTYEPEPARVRARGGGLSRIRRSLRHAAVSEAQKKAEGRQAHQARFRHHLATRATD